MAFTHHKVILLVCFLLSFPSCYFGGGVSGSNNLSLFNSLSSSGEFSAPADTEYFYIDLDVRKYVVGQNITPYYEISTTEEFGDSAARNSPSNCEIPLYLPEDSDSIEKLPSEDTLICILDVLEYDLMVKDLHIVYNFPEGMCNYVKVRLPWHFNHPVKEGPTVEECTITTNAGEDNASTVEGYTVDGGACTEKPEDFEEEDLCEGDPKCCFGGKKLDDSEWEPDDECFGGPAMIAEEEHRLALNTSLLLTAPNNGLKNTISLPSLITINDGLTENDVAKSTAHANYLKKLDVPSKRLKDVKRSQLPNFLKKITGYERAPEPFFKFECLDSAGETLHQILLMIREWNTVEEFIDFYEDGGNESANPDVEGTEGEDCKYNPRPGIDDLSDQCNDLLDFNNIEDCNTNFYPALCAALSNGYPQMEYSPEEEEE